MRLSTIFIALLPLAVVFGCGGPTNRAEVNGTVRLNGEPIPTGSIAFFPVEGTQGPSSGATITDGKYHVPAEKGIAVGKNRVSILSSKKTGRKVQRFGAWEDEWVRVIPPKYNDRSEIVCTVEPGSNQLDFDLEAEPAGR